MSLKKVVFFNEGVLHSSMPNLSTDHRLAPLAVGETAILLHPPLPSADVPIGKERGCQQSDSLADGYRRSRFESPRQRCAADGPAISSLLLPLSHSPCLPLLEAREGDTSRQETREGDTGKEIRREMRGMRQGEEERGECGAIGCAPLAWCFERPAPSHRRDSHYVH